MIYLILWAGFCVWLAWDNKKRIDGRKNINHLLNGALHVVASGCIGICLGWNLGMANLFAARLVFDSSLNLLRGLDLFYISPSPKSVVDRLEKKVVLWLAENVFTHHEPNDGVRRASITIKVFLFVKIVVLVLM